MQEDDKSQQSMNFKTLPTGSLSYFNLLEMSRVQKEKLGMVYKKRLLQEMRDHIEIIKQRKRIIEESIRVLSSRDEDLSRKRHREIKNILKLHEIAENSRRFDFTATEVENYSHVRISINRIKKEVSENSKPLSPLPDPEAVLDQRIVKTNNDTSIPSNDFSSVISAITPQDKLLLSIAVPASSITNTLRHRRSMSCRRQPISVHKRVRSTCDSSRISSTAADDCTLLWNTVDSIYRPFEEDHAKLVYGICECDNCFEYQPVRNTKHRSTCTSEFCPTGLDNLLSCLVPYEKDRKRSVISRLETSLKKSILADAKKSSQSKKSIKENTFSESSQLMEYQDNEDISNCIQEELGSLGLIGNSFSEGVIYPACRITDRIMELTSELVNTRQRNRVILEPYFSDFEREIKLDKVYKEKKYELNEMMMYLKSFHEDYE